LIDVFFGDEVAFSCTPYIPYRWGKKGKQICIGSEKKTGLKVLGLLQPLTQHLVTYPIAEGTSMNSELFIHFINDFVAQLTKPTMLILDNASWHKSKMTKLQMKQWQEKGLYIFFLPPKCPHLNLIETLWRKIKYEWLATKDYYSQNTLKNKIIHILKNYGNEYKINFSMNIFKKFIIESIL